MAKLQDLEYDEERVFPDNAQFPPGVAEAAERLTEWELEWLLVDCQSAFDCTHPDYQSPPKELLDKAGHDLVNFLGNYYDPDTGELWMLGK